jgi:hypothetical protein
MPMPRAPSHYHQGPACRLAGQTTETVLYLASALGFIDSDDFVSTQVKGVGRHAGNYNYYKISDDDEMCRLTEEARSPPSIEYGDCNEIASDLRDAPHHFSDDGILVHIHQRSGSVSGDATRETWKRPCANANTSKNSCNRSNEPLVTTCNVIFRPR